MFKIGEYGGVGILRDVTAQSQYILNSVTLELITYAVNLFTCGCHAGKVGQGKCVGVILDVFRYRLWYPVDCFETTLSADSDDADKPGHASNRYSEAVIGGIGLNTSKR